MLTPLRIGFGLCFSAVVAFGAMLASAAENKEVVVVYNSKMPESKRLAEYYAEKRQIPESQIFGFDLPQTETMTRREYEDKLQEPLLKQLESKKLLKFGSVPNPLRPGKTGKMTTESSIRYAVMCYGVPVKILSDPRFKDELTGKAPPPLNRNEASVDSELATLPLTYLDIPRTGPFNHASYAATNTALLHPTNGVLMVARLDGPTVEIAQGLVDKALMAEKDGLWGRAYFDSRGLTEGAYKMGDDWIKNCAQLAARYGYESIVHDGPNTYPTGFPMSHIALYFGWYDSQVSGPFAEPKVEFMPGAVAYHLHSFSANVLRNRDANWVGPLLAAGATATMGCTEEPYLDGTPDLPAFLSRFMLLGFTFGEAAYASQRSLSWQTTVVGDPLYRPFARKPQDIFEALEKSKNPHVEWAHLQVVNRLQFMGQPAETTIGYLEETPLTKESAILSEKLADLYRSKGKLAECIDPYLRALKLAESPKQRLRLSLVAARMLGTFDRPQEAYDIYSRLVREFSNYPEIRDVYAKLAEVAQTLGKKEEATEFRKKSLPPPEPAK
ncbi:MAG: TIGR03790 family protein [Verrucomicrobiales bacterium]